MPTFSKSERNQRPNTSRPVKPIAILLVFIALLAVGLTSCTQDDAAASGRLSACDPLVPEEHIPAVVDELSSHFVADWGDTTHRSLFACIALLFDRVLENQHRMLERLERLEAQLAR